MNITKKVDVQIETAWALLIENQFSVHQTGNKYVTRVNGWSLWVHSLAWTTDIRAGEEYIPPAVGLSRVSLKYHPDVSGLAG